MSTMTAFVEELIEDHMDVMDGLPDHCTRNLVTESMWRAEVALLVRSEEFITIRFQLEDVGGDQFKARFCLHKWNSDHGIIATEFLPVADLSTMTEALREKLVYWKAKPMIADGDNAQSFLTFVDRMSQTFSEQFVLDPKVPVT